HARLRDAASDELAVLVPTIDDRAVRRGLLSARRDLFNGRAREEELHQLFDAMDRRPSRAVDECASACERLRAAYVRLKSSHDREWQESKRSIAAALSHDALIRGILVASDSLGQQLVSVLRIRADLSAKRDDRLAMGALRYLT